MTCYRCGTCHKLIVGNQLQWCRSRGHEPPYDDEAGDDYE